MPKSSKTRTERNRLCRADGTFLSPASCLSATIVQPRPRGPGERPELSWTPSVQEPGEPGGAERWCDTAWPCRGLAEQGSVGTHCSMLRHALLKLSSCFPAGTPGLLHQSINTEQGVLIGCTFVWFKPRCLYSLKLPCATFAGAPTAFLVTCM